MSCEGKATELFKGRGRKKERRKKVIFCYVTWQLPPSPPPGQIVLPVKTRNIIFCSYEPLLQVTKNGMSLYCLHMMIIGVMWSYCYLTLFRNIWASAMFRDHLRSNGISGQNTEYHLLFVWTSSTSHNKHFAIYELQLCYATTSGKMTLPVKTRNIIFCSYGLPLL
jgi:hypothetical protein